MFEQEKDPSISTPTSGGSAGGRSLMARPKKAAAKPKIVSVQRESRKLQRILHPKAPVRTKYFTSAEGVNDENAIDMAKEPSPLVYPSDLEEFAQKVMTRAWRNDVRLKELNHKCAQRPSYKMRQRKGLLNRLYVKEPEVEDMKTMLDINPDHFNIVQGRPISNSLHIRDYIDTVRDTLRTRIITGYREDDIMLIDENLELEQRILDNIFTNFQTYVDTFEEFLYEDHTTAMQMLQNADDAASLSNQKYEEYRLISKMYGTMRSSLFNLEEKWRNCKTYQKFLYVTSPRIWRVGHKKLRRTSVFMVDDDPDDEANIFGRYRQSVVEKGVSLTDIIKTFIDELKDEVPPQLYFTEPEQLLDVFRFMEMQNLNSLIHAEGLALPLEQLKMGMADAEKAFEAEVKALQETIDKLEGGITWEEDRAEYLKEYAVQMVNNEFKTLMMDDAVLNLFAFVEDCYETRIAPNDANLSMSQMMKSIEERYRMELLILDKVPSEQVAMLKGSLYSEEMMIMRLAEKAAKQCEELERLTRSLNKAFEGPLQIPLVRQPKNRSPPPRVPKPIVIPPRSLTASEQQYLDYFTDFCIYTDNPSKYGIHINPVEEEKPTKKEEVDEEEESSTGETSMAAAK